MLYALSIIHSQGGRAMDLSKRNTELMEVTDEGSGASISELQESYLYMNQGFLRVYGERFIAFLHRIGLAGNLLDIGCGNCVIGSMILKQVFHVVSVIGVDINPVAIDMTKEQNVAVCMADVYNLPFGETFDAVLLFDVLHHLESPVDALHEVRRVLNPNGKVIIFDLARSMGAWQATLLGSQSDELSDVQKSIMRAYTRYEIVCMLDGFRNIESEVWLTAFNVVTAEI